MSSRDDFGSRLDSTYLDGKNRKDPALELIKELRDQNYKLVKKVRQLETRLEKKPRHPQDIMVIGDSHSRPGVPNDRYAWAARFANEHRPDVIVDIGDWADMESLWNLGEDRGKGSFEGARVQDDIDVAREARKIFKEELAYEPRLVSTTGNHENRINRFTDKYPIHASTYTTEKLGAEEFGWEVFPYGTVAVISGICFSHTPLNPTTGKEIGGIHKAHTALTKGLLSCVYGHDHCRGYREMLRTDHTKAMAVGVGCFFEQEEVYAGPGGNANWYRCLTLIKGAFDGYGHVEFTPMSEIKKKFG